MQFSDLDKKSQDETHRDAAVYENTRISNVSLKPTNELGATDLQTTSANYEELKFDTNQNEGKNVKVENKRDTFQWKDQPKEIKYIVYSLYVMLVILYIIVTIVVVVIFLPKSETDGLWTHWSPWSNCDVTCNNGTQTRTRLCTNPSKSNGQPDCFGDSSDTRNCQKDSCDDGVWSNWESWGSCSDSCGGGIKSRFRTCKNVGPSTHGKECKGSSEQVMLCNKNTCDDHKVAFQAYGSSTETTNTVIRFPLVSLNSGNGYNSSTGRFTCKVSGIYNFAVTLTKQRRDIDRIIAYLRINGSNKLMLYTDPSDTGDIDVGSYSLSVTGNFYLNTNDNVYAYSVPNHFINDISTSFTGVLVIPDN